MSWERVGSAGVDAGIILIADPCYVIRDPGDPPYAPFQNYGQLMDEIDKQDKEKGGNRVYPMPGALGVVVGGFGGDGVYPVYVQRDETGRVIAATIRFDGREP